MKNFKITLNAPVILVFALLCASATGLNYLTDGVSNATYFSTFRSSMTDPLTYLRLFTHVLGHADWDHLVGNMGYILLLGPLLEEKYGHNVIAVVIAVVALTTAICNSLFFPGSALLGASGICFAFILMSSFTSVQKGQIPVTFILVAVIYLGQQIYQGFFVSDNIANLDHIIGGVIGAVTGFYISNSGK